jgi:molecular chaperone GrpE
MMSNPEEEAKQGPAADEWMGPSEEEPQPEAPDVDDVAAATDEDDEVLSTTDELAASIDALESERDELRSRLLRTAAEFDNYRKRVARENERLRKTAAESLINDLLPVLDHLELALRHTAEESAGLAEGVEMVYNQLLQILAKHGLEVIPALNQPFDPNVHEAVMQREEPEEPEDTVVDAFQTGYRLGDRVLRPAKVIVSTGGPRRASSKAPREDEQSK